MALCLLSKFGAKGSVDSNTIKKPRSATVPGDRLRESSLGLIESGHNRSPGLHPALQDLATHWHSSSTCASPSPVCPRRVSIREVPRKIRLSCIHGTRCGYCSRVVYHPCNRRLNASLSDPPQFGRLSLSSCDVWTCISDVISNLMPQIVRNV